MYARHRPGYPQPFVARLRDATGAARAEFGRILRPPGWAALAWNTRRITGDPFSEGYERLLDRFGTDYAKVRHDRMDAAAIRGSSYTPEEGEPMRAVRSSRS
jgi:hypothetical protein